MDNYKVKLGWAKLLLIVFGMMLVNKVFASDSVDVPELQTQVSAGISIIQAVAKWGGIFAIVACGLTIGLGKAKGDVATVLCSVGIMIGVIGAGWGFYTTSFTHGFVF